MSKPDHPSADDSRAHAQTSSAHAENMLREARARVTSARVRVLGVLLNAPCAFTHQELQESLSDLDRVTLYRTLDFLTEAGLAHRIAGDDRIFRYSIGGEQTRGAGQAPHHQHGHFQCTRCTKIFCLERSQEASALGTALAMTLGRGFQSHDIELTIKGWCADCAH